MTSLFQVQEISKAFPGVQANDRVSFSMDSGEIHALLGENGSGKSTLVKTIYGIVRPDSGSMQLRGELYAPPSPNFARARGIAMVFQHFSLFDAMTVSENITLGMHRQSSARKLARRIRDTGDNYGLPLNPDAVIGDLSAGERQRVEIIRCLLQDPKLLIMDEPTSVLTPQEVDILFATLRKLAGEGTSILYISHKLEEIRDLCHSATILRAGKVVATCNPRNKSARELAELMVGESFQEPERTSAGLGESLFEVRSVSRKPATVFGMALKDISFLVRKGEILGIAGIAGNGQEELVSVLSGEEYPDSGEILLAETPVARTTTAFRRRRGLLVAPEERIGHSAAPDMSLVENAFMTGSERMKLTRLGIANWPASQLFAEKIIERFDVRTPGPSNAASSLSGGNLQKFVIGREILQDPLALVVNQPTWGVDAAAAAAIRQSLLDLAATGAAVVAVSQDLDELIEISTSVAVLNTGSLSEVRPVADITREELGMLMGGAHGMRKVPEGAVATA